jgi:hypothetical protein
MGRINVESFGIGLRSYRRIGVWGREGRGIRRGEG